MGSRRLLEREKSPFKSWPNSNLFVYVRTAVCFHEKTSCEHKVYLDFKKLIKRRKDWSASLSN